MTDPGPNPSPKPAGDSLTSLPQGGGLSASTHPVQPNGKGAEENGLAEAAQGGAVDEAETPRDRPWDRTLETLTEGMRDPILNKLVRVLVLKSVSEGFIVYLDENFEVQWWTGESFDAADTPALEGEAEVINEATRLETLSMPLMTYPEGIVPWLERMTRVTPDRRTRLVVDEGDSARVKLLNRLQRYPMAFEQTRRMIAAAIARWLSDRTPTEALKTLAQARVQLRHRTREAGRLWVLWSASLWVTPVAVAAGWLWFDRVRWQAAIGHGTHDTMMAIAFGCFGAFMAIVSGWTAIRLRPGAGEHYAMKQGMSRIFAGGLGALIVELAIRGNVILGLLGGSSANLSVRLLIAFVAGTSERLVTKLVHDWVRSLAGDEPETPSGGVGPPPSPAPADGAEPTAPTPPATPNADAVKWPNRAPVPAAEPNATSISISTSAAAAKSN